MNLRNFALGTTFALLSGPGMIGCDARTNDTAFAWDISSEPWQISTCQEYSPPLNFLYLTPPYFARFHSDAHQYEAVIMGDSTMDISARYPGFSADSTQSVAVSGNTICDMVVQLPAINSANPKFVLIGGGANDLKFIPRIPVEKIINTGTILIQSIGQKFPNTKLIIIGIHPRQDPYVNTAKGAVNAGIRAALEASPLKHCYFDPLPLFGVPEGESARSENLMEDRMHYNAEMSFRIKAAVELACSFSF